MPLPHLLVPSRLALGLELTPTRALTHLTRAQPLLKLGQLGQEGHEDLEPLEPDDLGAQDLISG